MSKPKKLEPVYLVPDIPVDILDGDSLGLDPIARTIAGAALGTPGPFTIGVYGAWGHGKTSALRLAKCLLESEDTNPDRPIATVWFNAWQHEKEEHPLFPLIAAVVEGLEESEKRIKKDTKAAQQVK